MNAFWVRLRSWLFYDPQCLLRSVVTKWILWPLCGRCRASGKFLFLGPLLYKEVIFLVRFYTWSHFHWTQWQELGSWHVLHVLQNSRLTRWSINSPLCCVTDTVSCWHSLTLQNSPWIHVWGWTSEYDSPKRSLNWYRGTTSGAVALRGRGTAGILPGLNKGRAVQKQGRWVAHRRGLAAAGCSPAASGGASSCCCSISAVMVGGQWCTGVTAGQRAMAGSTEVEWSLQPLWETLLLEAHPGVERLLRSWTEI